MARINNGRIWLGALAGGVVWTIWTMIVNIAVLKNNYATGQEAGQLLENPRYPYFLVVWILTLFLLSYVGTWLYASVRATQGAGPGTALKVGILLGFTAGFPMNFSLTSWANFPRVLPFWWTLDLWVGAILAVLIAGWLYKE